MLSVPTGTPCAAASSGQAISVASEQPPLFVTPSFGLGGLPRGAASSGSHLSAVAFRERMSQLADEYEYMHAVLTRAILAEEPEVPPPPGESCRGCVDRPSGEGPAPANTRQLEDLGEFEARETDPNHSPKSAENALLTVPSPVAEYVSDIQISEKKLNIRKLITEDRARSVSWDTPITCIAHSPVFERIISVVIVVNIVCLGISADLELADVRRGDFDTSYTPLVVLEKVFLAVYVVELLVRLIAFGKDFFFDENDRFWNVFDMSLVLQSIFEQVSTSLDGTGALNLSFLRAMRLIKVVKMLRVIRLMRSMRELRLILTAIIGSVRSMLWSLVLLATCLFMFSLIFVQGITTHIRDAHETADEGLDEDSMVYWESVATSMATLFKSSTGGIDWNNALPTVSEAGLPFLGLFFIYIAFFLFVILNMVTALFVEATIASAKSDISSTIQNELEKKADYVKSLLQLFNTMDSSGDGHVSLEEFLHEVSNPKMVAFFSSLGIPISDAEIFFRVLSNDGTTNVHLDQFVASCIRMRGGAQAIDLQYLISKQTAALEEVGKIRNDLEAAKSSLLEAFRAPIASATPQPCVFAGSVEQASPSVHVRDGSSWRARSPPRIHEKAPAPAFASSSINPPSTASTPVDCDAWNPKLWMAQ